MPQMLQCVRNKVEHKDAKKLSTFMESLEKTATELRGQMKYAT